MEVVVVSATSAEFNLDSTSTTPYVSAPSSPRGFGEWTGRYYYTSAPTSPSRAASIFRDFNAAMAGGLGSPRPSSRSSVIPFDWEEAPGNPKSPSRDEGAAEDDDDDDFAFEFSGHLEIGGSSPLTADELFEEGMIRPLKLPPRLQHVSLPPVGAPGERSPVAAAAASPRSPKSPKSPRSRFFRSPRLWGKQQEEDDFDPFARALEETTRGRDRATTDGGTRRAARSLSPLRGVFDFGRKHASPAGDNTTNNAGTVSSGAAARWIKGGSKKWRLRDLLLFRSASEGRATGGGGGKDPLRKFTALSPSSSAMLLSRKGSAASISSPAAGGPDDSRNASFRSTESASVGGSSRRRGGSAHGRHYAAASRATAEEMRRKTMLPYGQGLFGCLGFNPAINGLARGFSSLSRTRS